MHNLYQSFIRNMIIRRSFKWPADPADLPFIDYFLRQTRRDGIPLLIHDWAYSKPEWHTWPLKVRQSLIETARNDAIVDLMRQQDLASLFLKLTQSNFKPVVLKGAALSLTVYAQPHLRSRSDTDILVEPNSWSKLQKFMRDEGYQSESFIDGHFINHQDVYVKTMPNGIKCFYDLHRKILNPQDFCDALTHEEVFREAQNVPLFDQTLKAISPRHALLHACMHRAAHHYNDSKLLWLYDIHLLLSEKNPSWREDFYRLASQKKMRKVCGHSFELAKKEFATEISEEWINRFTHCKENEPSARFLTFKPSRLSLFLTNLSPLSRKEKMKLLREHLFPSLEFMKAKYKIRHKALLPVFYFWRIAAGVPRAFRRIR